MSKAKQGKRVDLDGLAHGIAYDAAVSGIECAALMQEGDWLDVGSLEPYEADGIEEYLRYLDLRGLLQRHLENRNWVKVLEESEASGS